MTRTNIALTSLVALAAGCQVTDPGPCQPGDATFSTLRGAVTIPGSPSQAFDIADAPGAATCTVVSRSSGDRNADVAMRTSVDLLCERDGERLSVTFEVDDLRDLDAGAHVLDTGEYGLRISYRPNESAPECYTYLADTSYQLTVTDAAGDFALYPALVTADFRRTVDVDLALALHGRRAKQYTNGVVSECALDFTGTIAFAASVEAVDYQARATDTCILE